MNSAWNTVCAMVGKDLRREWRTREIFISSFLLSVVMLCAFYFGAVTAGIPFDRWGAGALWICILFSGTIGLNRTHQSELNEGCYRALMMTPVDGGWLYLAKVTTNAILLFTTLALFLPLLGILLQVPVWDHLGSLLASLFLGVLAFCAIGTLVVVITGNTRMKDVLFPMIQLPLVVPLLIAGVNSTHLGLKGEDASQWLQFLAALNLVFLPTGFLLYEFLLEE